MNLVLWTSWVFFTLLLITAHDAAASSTEREREKSSGDRKQLMDGRSDRESDTFSLCQQLNRLLSNVTGAEPIVLKLNRHLQLEQYHQRQLLELQLEAALIQKEEHQRVDDETLRQVELHRSKVRFHESARHAIAAQLQQKVNARAVDASAHYDATWSQAVDLLFLQHCLLLPHPKLGPNTRPDKHHLETHSSLPSHGQAQWYNHRLHGRSQSAAQPPELSRPLVSLLVQYFNRPWMLPLLVEPFRSCSAAHSNTFLGDDTTSDTTASTGKSNRSSNSSDRSSSSNTRGGSSSSLGFGIEMLINVDSRIDAAAVAEFASGPLGSDFVVLVFSNNVHEIRSYNRLAQMARGKILIMMQDDDVFPAETACAWLESVVRAFRRWPRLGAVGSQRYVFDYHPNTTDTGVHFWDPGAPGARKPGGSTGDSEGIEDAASAAIDDTNADADNEDVEGEGKEAPAMVEEASNDGRLRMQFVTIVDYAPIAVRRGAFLGVGGIDEGMSDAGMCGVHSDYDLTLRMWLSGWQVAYIEVPGLDKDPREGEGGTHRPGVSGYCWERQWELAIGYMRERWGQYNRWNPDSYYWFGSNVFEVVAEHVRLLNLRLLAPLAEPPGSFCPFGYGCEDTPVDRITG
ncbi:hypothetical protein Agub_g13957, partial [Astrephomene gubernaculifera]